MTNRRIELGCMGMSGMYGPADDAESVATIRAAVDAGIITAAVIVSIAATTTATS
jgi:aryl-alcohol dehydrogenase-like predicted oxidoreductase